MTSSKKRADGGNHLALVDATSQEADSKATDTQKQDGEVGPLSQIIDREFPYVTYGYTQTLLALQVHFSGLGFPPQSYQAELVMFMERSFRGKYLRGERSHYQHVRPCRRCRAGDSLAEKLTRCKDKETFKRRFDKWMGTTLTLCRDHFDDFKIATPVPEAFGGRLYLRLIDTSHGNRSDFFRDDRRVRPFLEDVIALHEKGRSGRVGMNSRSRPATKPEVVEAGIPELVGLENPKSLPSEVAGKPSGKKQWQPPVAPHRSLTTTPTPLAGRIERKKPTAGVGLGPPHLLQGGTAIYEMWRSALKSVHPREVITAHPTGQLQKQASQFFVRFSEQLPPDELPRFLTTLITHWSVACKWFKGSAGLFSLSRYPDLPWLLKNSNHALTWYMKHKQTVVEPPAQKAKCAAIQAPTAELKNSAASSSPMALIRPKPEPDEVPMTREELQEIIRSEKRGGGIAAEHGNHRVQSQKGREYGLPNVPSQMHRTREN